jgi:hypothetical protein
MKDHRSLLSHAIQLRDWETVALCLLLGVTRAARAFPPETLEEMVELLAGTRRASKSGGRDS